MKKVRQEHCPPRFAPFLDWFRAYGPVDLKKDVMAGLTVSVVLIPQSIAYAMVAGLPPIYGLYAAAVTPILGAMWGSLRQLSTGPVAIKSLLTLTALSPFLDPGSTQYIEAAFLLAFMVGAMYLLIGAFRMGLIMSFISHSAVKGFTSAAALIITTTQIPHLLGLKTARHEFIIFGLAEIVQKVTQLHLPTLLTGLAAFAIIQGVKRVNRQLPSGLIAIFVTGAALHFIGPGAGVALVGEFPSGLPSFHLPFAAGNLALDLLPSALILALVSFVETYSVDRIISARTGQKVDTDQEFIGQGVANFVGSFFQCFPVSGSFSRTAVNQEAGARTGFSSVIVSVVVVLALLYFTPVLRGIPRASLAALVVSAVWSLFHPKEVFALLKMNRHDGIVAMSVFFISLILKPDYALLIGMAFSMIFFLWKTMHPRIVRVSKDPALNMFINADDQGMPSCPQILQLRSDNAIFFANAEYTVDHILSRVDEQDAPLRFLLLDLSAAGFIDVTGADELTRLKTELSLRGVALAVTGIHMPVCDVLNTTGFLQEARECRLLPGQHEAIVHLFSKLDHAFCRDGCPHRLFTECSTVK